MSQLMLYNVAGEKKHRKYSIVKCGPLVPGAVKIESQVGYDYSFPGRHPGWFF